MLPVQFLSHPGFGVPQSSIWWQRDLSLRFMKTFHCIQKASSSLTGDKFQAFILWSDSHSEGC